MSTPMTSERLAAELAALVTTPTEFPPLPAGLTPGHRYAYKGHGRMGVVLAREDGALLNTMKSPVVASWPTAHGEHLVFSHATADCPGCPR